MSYVLPVLAIFKIIQIVIFLVAVYVINNQIAIANKAKHYKSMDCTAIFFTVAQLNPQVATAVFLWGY
jgi:hypothetical protein